jgi:hypothetical protein
MEFIIDNRLKLVVYETLQITISSYHQPLTLNHMLRIIFCPNNHIVNLCQYNHKK